MQLHMRSYPFLLVPLLRATPPAFTNLAEGQVAERPAVKAAQITPQNPPQTAG
jgi:hypothetical protein